MAGYDPRYYFKDRHPPTRPSAVIPPAAYPPPAMSMPPLPAVPPAISMPPPPPTPSTIRSKASKYFPSIHNPFKHMHLGRKKDSQKGCSEDSQGQGSSSNVGNEEVSVATLARDADFLGTMFQGDIVMNRMDDQRAVLRSPAERPRRKQKIYQPWKRPEGNITYSCEIDAESSEVFSNAESKCKSIVRMHHGTILEDRTFPGGFLFTLQAHHGGTLPIDRDLVGTANVTITRRRPVTPPPADDDQDEEEEPTLHTATAVSITTPTKGEMSKLDQLIEENDPASYSPAHHSREQSAASGAASPASRDYDNDFLIGLARVADDYDDHAGKAWPRPRDSREILRSANWVKDRAAKYQEGLMKEAQEGTGMECSGFQMTDAEVGGMYLDGFTPLADWMAAGCQLGPDETISGQ